MIRNGTIVLINAPKSCPAWHGCRGTVTELNVDLWEKGATIVNIDGHGEVAFRADELEPIIQ